MGPNNNLILGAGQSHELELAFRRNGWTNADIKALSEGGILGEVLEVIKKRAQIVYSEHLIDKKVLPKWTEVNNRICFTVTSNGKTGPEWIERLKAQGSRVTRCAESMLRSESFKPTNGVTYEVVVLKGKSFASHNLVNKKIRAKAAELKLIAPNAEVACLIRELFTDDDLKAMGLWCIVTMHEPIEDVGDPGLLSVVCYDDVTLLDGFSGEPASEWDESCAFAFVAL